MPDLRLSQVKVKLEQGSLMLVTRIQSPVATLFRNLQVKAEVTERGSQKILERQRTNGMTIAPATQFNYLMKLKSLSPGHYKLKVTATSGTKRWRFIKPFTISKGQAWQFKQTHQVQSGFSWWLLVLSALLIMLIGFWWHQYRLKRTIRDDF